MRTKVEEGLREERDKLRKQLRGCCCDVSVKARVAQLSDINEELREHIRAALFCLRNGLRQDSSKIDCAKIVLNNALKDQL